MAVRFIDTSIWDEDWFCELGSEYQNFWTYLTCECDNAGIWKPNKIGFEIKSRTKINLVAFLQKVNEQGGKERILTLESGRWFLTGFIAFQWFNKKDSFDLALSNKLHKHIYELLVKNNVDLKTVRGLKEVLLDLKGQGQGKGYGDKEKGGVGEKVELSRGGFFSDSLDPTMPLDQNQVDMTIQYISILNKRTLTAKEVTDYWKAFKIQQFAKHEWYNDTGALIGHFRDQLKNQLNKTNGNSSLSKVGKEIEFD